jgi:thymidylate kinase
MVMSAREPLATLPRFIYITGCDGTGKTTQASLLVDQLQARGIKTRQLWLRFPFFLSLPLLAYARARGLSWYEKTGNVNHGYWDFRSSRLLRTFLPWTLLIDAVFAGLVKIYLPLWLGKTVVCERFVLDMLADLSVAFDDAQLHRKFPGRLYPGLLPRLAKIFVLELDPETIRARRADLRTDQRLDARLRAYQNLSRDLSLKTCSSQLPASDINQRIIASVFGGAEALPVETTDQV